MQVKHSESTGNGTWLLIAAGSIVAGMVDFIYAIASNAHAGIPAIVIPQAVASGVLGLPAFREGAASATLGVALHFSILFVAAALYFLASRKLRVMATRPLLAGPLYGLAIYLFMHLIVLPLSLAPSFEATPVSITRDLLVHVLLIGPLLAYAAHRALKRR